MRALVTCLVALPLVACATLPFYDYSKEPDPRDEEYVLGVSDVVRITVWKNPDLTTEAQIRPDGTITLPLIGDLKAANHTPGELKRAITKRLEQFIKDEGAVVSVAVTEVNSYRFTVSGQVARPGLFTPRSYVTVAEAIAMAGGATPFATPEQTVILRAADRERPTRRIPIDFRALSRGKHLEMNVVLLAGDTVFVP